MHTRHETAPAVDITPRPLPAARRRRLDLEVVMRALSGAAVTWTFLADDASPATTVHRAFPRTAWRGTGLAGRAALVIGFLVSPLTALVTTAVYTARCGPAVRRKCGKGLARQAGEQLNLALTRSVYPPWYYLFDLYENGRRARALHFLYRHETKRGIYNFLRAQQPARERSTDYLSNKAAFPGWCVRHGVRAVPALAVLAEGRLRTLDGSPCAPPHTDLFLIPQRGAGGRGARRWLYRGAGTYEDEAGTLVDSTGLLAQLAALSRRRAYVVRPRVTNHPDLSEVANGALATVRAMTCRNETGEIEVTDAVFRMARGNRAVVDNFHAGGIVAPVDVASGTLGAARDMGVAGESFPRHPDTGAAIAGRQLPLWADVLDLVGRAHARAFADQVVVGWDVAILADGPALIEGNKCPDVDLIQRASGRPLASGRLGELLAYHLSRAFADDGTAYRP